MRCKGKKLSPLQMEALPAVQSVLLFDASVASSPTVPLEPSYLQMLFKRPSTPRRIRHDHLRALQMQRYLHSHPLPPIDYNSRLLFNIIRNE